MPGPREAGGTQRHPLVELVQETWQREGGNDDDPYHLKGRLCYPGEKLKR